MDMDNSEVTAEGGGGWRWKRYREKKMVMEKNQIKLKIKIKKCSFTVVLGHTAKSISMEQNNRKLYSSIVI